MQETEKIWMNGELVDWADAKIHVASHGLNYGSGVFEGIRCYDTPDGPAVFRLTDHLVRLENSAKVLYMDLPYSVEEIRSATHELVAANGLASCYLRPLAFYGYGELGVSSVGNPVDVVIVSFPWGAYLGEDSQSLGITTKISSWERVGPNVIPHVAKATGIYLNSMLATMEARRGGYDEAIMLSHDGYVADGPGENIFVVKDGVLHTPPLAMSILPGITRDTVIQIAQDLGHRVEESAAHPHRPLPRRRGLHGRHGDRGRADSRGRRPRDRRRSGHARASAGVPRHGPGTQRALEPLARRRRDVALGGVAAR